MPFDSAISVEVRPRAVERAGGFGEPGVGGLRVAVLEERPLDVRAAEPERVRRIGVPREEQRPREASASAVTVLTAGSEPGSRSAAEPPA